MIDSVISDKHVESFVKSDYHPKKGQSPLTKIVVYDLETFNKLRAVPCCNCIYKLSKTSGKYHRDISEKEFQKSPNDCWFLRELIVLMKCYIMFYRSKEKLKKSITYLLNTICI